MSQRNVKLIDNNLLGLDFTIRNLEMVRAGIRQAVAALAPGGHLLHVSLLIGFLLTASVMTIAGPKFSRGVSTSGAIAYQDDADSTQFHYLPTNVPVILGENGTLTDFKVVYWGIGNRFLVQDTSGGLHKSRVGATVAGRAKFDITESQRQNLVTEIQKAYGISVPKLLPLRLTEVSVVPVVDTSTIGLGGKDVSVIFPKEIAFGSAFNFSVGTGNSLFAQFAANQNVAATGIKSNPNFAVNIVGKAEFVGDPWRARCTADLNQVWKKVRTEVSASIGWGWFNIGSGQYSSIVQDLTRTGVIQCTFQEGSLDNEKYGRQILELGKKVFEAINAKAASGEGFFKFEPNPEPPAIEGGKARWWPWRVSINAGYSSVHSKQNMSWTEDVSYTGRFMVSIPASMILAVDCNAATSQYFVELGMAAQPCVTDVKSATLQQRLQAENTVKMARINKQLERMENGDITPEAFEKILAIYNTLSFTEDLQQTPIGQLTAVLRKADRATLSIGDEGATQFTVGLSDADITRLEEEAIAVSPRRAPPR